MSEYRQHIRRASDRHTGAHGCNCPKCPRKRKESGSFEQHFASMRKELEKTIKSMPSRLLKPGCQGPSLLKCLSTMVDLGEEAIVDRRLLDAHVLSGVDAARPILAAGLYSDAEDCQLKALHCMHDVVNDGDLHRGFPDYWKPFKRLLELLDADSWEVVGKSALAIAGLCSGHVYCPETSVPRSCIQHFYHMGTIDKLIKLLTREAVKKSRKGYSREEAHMECCFVLSLLLGDSEALGGPSLAAQPVLEAPGLLPRLVELANFVDKRGEIQRVALACLAIIGGLNEEIEQAVLDSGAKEAAEKILRKSEDTAVCDTIKEKAAQLLTTLGCELPPHKMGACGCPTVSDVKSWTVKEVKAYLKHHGISYASCVEKADLQEKVQAFLKVRSGMHEDTCSANAPAKALLGAADAAGSAGPASLDDPSIEVLRKNLEQMNINTAGCVEREDLIDRMKAWMREKYEADAQTHPNLLPPLPSSENDLDSILEHLKSNKRARSLARKMVAQLVHAGKLPAGSSVESTVRLMVDGETPEERRSGLRVMKAPLKEDSHPARRELADCGFVYATVQMLNDPDASVRFEAWDTLVGFSRSPSLSPKLWRYGVLSAVSVELNRPAIMEAVQSQLPDILRNLDSTYQLVMLCLMLLGNMLLPATMEETLEAGRKVVLDVELGEGDAFTHKLAEWILEHKVHELIAELLTIARVTSWNATWNKVAANNVLSFGLRILLQLMQQGQEEKVLCLPGLAESMVYLIEQWETSEPESTSANSFLSQVFMYHDESLARFLTTDEMVRVLRALKGSTSLPESTSSVSHSARASMAEALKDELIGFMQAPQELPPHADISHTAEFWCDSLQMAKDADAAERIVRNLLGSQRKFPAMVTEQELSMCEFWDLLARRAVRFRDRRFLLYTFTEAFNPCPDASGVPLEDGAKRLWGLSETWRPILVAKLVARGLVQTLAKASLADETAVHVMRFWSYAASAVKDRASLSRGLLRNDDLMLCLLRFALLESGCVLGVVGAKAAVKALLSLNPNRKTSADEELPLTVRQEIEPDRPTDSIRYEFHEDIIYVGSEHFKDATNKAPNFLAKGRRMLQEYNEEHPERPLRLAELEPLGGEKGRQSRPPKKKQCGSCGKTPAKSKCSRCEKVVYCSKDCQVESWPAHKLKCLPKNA